MSKNSSELATFQYQGTSQTGEKLKGVVSARSMALAKAELRKQGILTSKVVKQGKPLFAKKPKKIIWGF